MLRDTVRILNKSIKKSMRAIILFQRNIHIAISDPEDKTPKTQLVDRHKHTGKSTKRACNNFAYLRSFVIEP